jgi:hypothetical protein
MRKCLISSRTNSTLSQVRSSGPSTFDLVVVVVVVPSSDVVVVDESLLLSSKGETIVLSVNCVVVVIAAILRGCTVVKAVVIDIDRRIRHDARTVWIDMIILWLFLLRFVLDYC